MPTYEYACQSCGHHVEVYQRFSDAPLTECAVCGGPLRKVFHPAGILFKGSGFYATDSRSSAKRSSDGAGGGGDKTSSGAASGDKGSATAAPAAKSEAPSGSSKSSSTSSGSSSKEQSA